MSKKEVKEKKQQKSSKKNPKGKTIKREIEFKLTSDEFAEKGKEAAEAAAAVTDLETEFEGVKEVWKAKIKNKEAERDTALDAIRVGTEKRFVDVVEVKKFENNSVEYYFNGKKVDERSMEARDRQAELPLKEKKAKKPKGEESPEKVPAGASVTPIRKDPVAAAHSKDEASDHADLASVIKEETNVRSKWSSVDGSKA